MFDQLETAISRVDRAIQGQLRKRPWILLAFLAALSFLVFSLYSINRYLALQSNFFDLGLEASSMWRVLNGYESWSTLVLPSTPGHINHISPILGLVALVYAVVPDPRTLLVIQAGVLSVAVVPLYMLAVRETGSHLVSLVLSVLYLLNPGLHGIVRYDFHPESFIPLAVFLVYYSYGRQKAGLFYLSTALLLATIEYSAILGLGTALSLFLTKRRFDNRILAIFASSLALLLIILFSTVLPAFQALNWPPNWLGVQFLGSSTAPQTGTDIFAKSTYFLVVASPLWFSTARYVTRMMAGLPWLAIVFTSSRYAFTSFDFQYTAFVIPFVCLAAIPFLHHLMKARKALLALVVMAVCITVVYSSLSPFGPHGQWPQPDPLASTVVMLGNSLPQNATILTQSDLFPQLSDRPYVGLDYSSAKPPEYILVNTRSPFYNWTDPGLGYPTSARQQLKQLTGNYTYHLLFVDQGLQLYKLDTIQSRQLSASQVATGMTGAYIDLRFEAWTLAAKRDALCSVAQS